ncbi:MAG: hemolysin D [Planctomycetaceae bacterium]|nr:hemolysin D [Planctomycetaceae bacterium]
MSSEQGSVDAATIERTKNQIRGLVQEIAQLSRGDLEPEQYYAEVMQRIVTALAAIGGAVWTINSERQLRLDYQINLSQHLLDPQSEDSRRHVRLLQEVMASGEARLVPPLSGGGEPDAAGNPTNTLLVLAPVKSDESVEGVLEIFQRPDSAANSQQGYRRFLVQMSDLVGDWLKSRKLRHFSDRQSMWAKIDQFSKEIHNSLDVRDTCYTIANEGRRLIGCDRVSVTVARGNQHTVEAVSGQDTMDSRSNVVTMLRNLATRVCATGEPLWYNGSMQDLPPQVEEALEAYVDESHTKSLAVLPLFKSDLLKTQEKDEELGVETQEKYQSDKGDVIGSVIVEQIDDVQSRSIVGPRADLVCQHSARALGNSMEHNSLFLMPLWRTIGKSRVLVTGRNLPKTLLISGLIFGTLLALLVLPKTFELKAEGTLEPVDRQYVYFGAAGEVAEVPVDHGATVSQGDPLVILESNELELELAQLRGQKESAEEARDAVLRSIRESKDNSLFATYVKLGQEIIGYKKQLLILQDRLEKLRVTSPIDGVVTSWDVKETLRGRPVNIGQVAVEVANPNGPWELIVYLSDKKIGHMVNAEEEMGTKELPVKFVIKSHPGDTFNGTVQAVQEAATLHDEHGYSYRVRITLDKQDVLSRLNLAELNKGTEVMAKIECGQRSMAYCFFHELIEWVQIRLFAI